MKERKSDVKYTGFETLKNPYSPTVALLVTRLARMAKRSVLCVSSECVDAGVTLHTMAVA